MSLSSPLIGYVQHPFGTNYKNQCIVKFVTNVNVQILELDYSDLMLTNITVVVGLGYIIVIKANFTKPTHSMLIKVYTNWLIFRK